MKRNYVSSLLMFCMSAVGCSRVAATALRELTIPNFDADSPDCIVKLPDVDPACTVESCTISAPKGATTGPMRINFSCLPKSAPTGFENPAPDVKVQSFRSKNAKGHLSLIDDVQSGSAERMRELNFCLYGKLKNFCGNAKVQRLSGGAKTDGSSEIKAFIQRIELQGAAFK